MSRNVFELSEGRKKELADMFGERVNVRKRERHFYNHDVGALPSMVRRFLGKAEPAAIVKIRDEDDVRKLLAFASKYSVPVVPRAGATSGYGGVIPTKGGIIADVGLLNNIHAVDRENMQVTVGAGIVWERLEQQLNKEGLSVCALPSSAPAATVGGWLAQNGVGYGSYEYGWSQDTITGAKIILPAGQIREFKGDELAAIAGNYGSLGIITEVTVKLRQYEKTTGVSAAFKDAISLQKAIGLIGKRSLPLWSVTFINPAFAGMKNKAPAKLHHGEKMETHRPELPEAYVCNFFYPANRDMTGLEDAIRETGGEVLPEEISEHETGEWFRSMKVKRLGPSFIPAEVVIPADKLDSVITGINKAVSLPVLMEGMVAKGDEIVLLCFIPHSEREFKFNLAFPLALSIIRIAEENGGRMYATGLYFAKDAPKVYGDHFRKLTELKKQVDPEDIMNPETLTGRGLFNTAISMSRTFEPLMRLTANMAGAGKQDFKKEKGIPADVISHAYTCAQCGYCVNQCDQYYGRGWESQSPRGKWFFIKEYLAGRDKMVQEQVDTFLACTTCELCDVRCQLDLPIENSWMGLRQELVEEEGKMTFPPFEIMAQSLDKERNIWASYRKDRDGWVPDDLIPKIKDKADYAYFAGCTASFVEKDIAEGTARMLDDAGIEFTTLGKDESCCGIPMLAAGKWEDFERIMRMNVGNMKKKGAKTVITSCPACWFVWHTYYRQWAEKLGMDYDFEVKHYSEVLAERLDVLAPKFKVPLKKTVTVHDACHMGRAGGIYEPPRQLVKAIPGVDFREMEHNRENGHCCGSVLTLVDDPDVANVIGNIRLKEAEDVGADVMLAACPCCQVQLRVSAEKNNSPVDVQDLGATVARSLGYNIPDTTNEALAGWAVFEQMIYLMKPENMTDLMAELLPQMMGAMPSYMQAMMKMVKIPGMDRIMAPMMPKMMPLLMPSLMPKVMPDMLAAVERHIDMPEEMREQLPDLMPRAMGNLMPNMLPQIAPLLTPRMIDYIKAH